MSKLLFPDSYSNHIIKKVLDFVPLEKIVQATFGYSGKKLELIKSNLNIIKLEILEASLAKIKTIDKIDIKDSQMLLNKLAKKMTERDTLSPDEINDLLETKINNEDSEEYLISEWLPNVDNVYTKKIEEYIKSHSIDESLESIESLIVNPHPIVKTLVAFSELARKEGLLALEDYLDDIKSNYISQSLQLVIDGTDPELVKSIMNTRIVRLSYEYQSLLEMISEGILSIQNGDNPVIVQTKLLNYLPY
ncbi:MAG: hypothetical protein ABUK01_19130 [Leptospirales bacterium]